MMVHCWGARGSVPVSGEEYTRYGGDTTCLEIRTKSDEIIIVDAGSGIRRLGNRLLAENRRHYTMLFTHAHWDHLLGFPFFKPIYVDGTSLSLYGSPFVQTSVKNIIAPIMVSPNFPVNFEDLKIKIHYHESCDSLFAVDRMEITPIPLSHPNQGVGYKFSEDGKVLVFLTDNELRYKHPGGLDYRNYVDFASQADVLIHDAEYLDSEYPLKSSWGHSTYTQAVQLAIDAKVKKLGLFHHNQERSDAAIDAIVGHCCKIIREQRATLECFAVHQSMGITLGD